MGIGLLYLWQSSDLSGRMSLNLAGICGLIGFTTALGSSPVFWDLSFATLELRGSGVVRCIYSSSMYVQAPALVAQPSSEALALADSLLRYIFPRFYASHIHLSVLFSSCYSMCFASLGHSKFALAINSLLDSWVFQAHNWEGPLTYLQMCCFSKLWLGNCRIYTSILVRVCPHTWVGILDFFPLFGMGLWYSIWGCVWANCEGVHLQSIYLLLRRHKTSWNSRHLQHTFLSIQPCWMPLLFEPRSVSS